MRFSICILLALATWQSSMAAELPYVKKASREETRQATLDALAKMSGVGKVTQSPWKFVGPFDNPKGTGIEIVYPPQKKVDLSANYDGLDGQKIRWQDGSKWEDGKINNLDIFSRKDWVLCYLYRTITAEAEGDATLFVGSDDAIQIWLNGRRVHDYRGSRPTKLDSDFVSIHLQAGENRLLMKVANYQGYYSFAYRLALYDTALVSQLEEKLDQDFPTGEAAYYRMESIAIPDGVKLEVGGLAFTPDGKLMITTRRGEIWAWKPGTSQWKRFASGLHEVLGIYPLGPGDVVIAQRPELTHIRDTDGDGEADLFETMADEFGISGNYHEFHFGPVRDKAGNFYGTLNVAWEGKGTAPVPFRGVMYQLTPKGEFSMYAMGFRSPAGIGMSPKGDLFVADNQGDWWGTSPLLHVKAGEFMGHPASLKWMANYSGPPDPHDIPPAELKPLRTLPSAWFVINKLGRSPTQPVWDTTEGKFGPFAGDIIVGDQTKSFLMRASLEMVGDDYQGAIFPFRAGFATGIMRLCFDEKGALYVGGTDRGWGAVGGRPYALQKLTWTGKVPFEVAHMKLTKKGFDLEFTKPVDKATAAKVGNYSFQHYYYKYWRTYGSPEMEVTPVSVSEAKVSADGKTVSLILPTLVKEVIYELNLKGIKAADGSDLLHSEAYYTLNRLLP